MSSFIINSIAQKIGVPSDQIVLVLSIFAAIPLGIINYFIKSPQLRLWYGFLTGLYIQYSWYGNGGIVHTFIASTGTYLFIEHLGRKYSAMWVFAWTFLHLTSLHLYRMFFVFEQWTADDPTSIYMMTICKYSSMAFSYEDGGKEEKDIKSCHWKRNRWINKPTLLEVLSFAFYYPSAIIGPSFEFKDFHDFIHLNGCYSHLPIKGVAMYGSMYTAISFAVMAFYGFLGPRYPLSYVGTVEYGNKSLLYQLFYMNFSMWVHRSKFYTGWLWSYTGMIVCGLAYTEIPKNENSIATKGEDIPSFNFLNNEGDEIEKNFEKGEYGSIIDCEFGINPKTKITSWNHSVHLWLKYYLFLRLINFKGTVLENNSGLASWLTFMWSAFWHGFYPTYYIFFFLFFVFQTANEKIDKLGFYVWARKRLSTRIVVWICCQYICNALGAIIFNLQWGLFVQYLRNCYCAPIVIVFALFGYSKTIKIKREGKGNAQRKEGKAVEKKEQ